MKLSISNIAWTVADDAEMYRFLSDNGFAGLEIAPTRIFQENPYNHSHEAISFRENMISEYSLEISSLQSICFGREEAIFGSEEDSEAIKAYVKKAIDFAAFLDCKNLVFGSPKNRVIKDGQYNKAIDFFSELAGYANSRSTTLSIEPNPVIYGTNFINTTAQAVRFVKDVNNEGLKVNLDLGTVLYNKESLDEVSSNIALINHVHISEPFLEAIQEREIHRELAEVLNTAGYNKFISIEMKNLNNLTLVKEAVLYINNIFNGN
jgi:sugar phosphate isomerase/epimerase